MSQLWKVPVSFSGHPLLSVIWVFRAARGPSCLSSQGSSSAHSSSCRLSAAAAGPWLKEEDGRPELKSLGKKGCPPARPPSEEPPQSG